MSHQYSTALSHVVLAGTGLWCWRIYGGDTLQFPQITFGLITTHSLLGIWKWGSDSGDNVNKPYEATGFLQTIFALPCISTEIWLMYNYQKEIADLHVVASLIPLAQYLADRSHKDFIDTILIVNTLSIGIVSYIHQNFYGVAAAITFGLNHFVISDDGECFDIPSKDLYNYGMCFFTYFALRALGGK